MHHFTDPTDGENVVTLDPSETFWMPGDRSTQWPMIVRVLLWHPDATNVLVVGSRADRNGDPIEHQSTSEHLMLGGVESRFQHFPAWLIDALSRGTSPLQLV